MATEDTKTIQPIYRWRHCEVGSNSTVVEVEVMCHACGASEAQLGVDSSETKELLSDRILTSNDFVLLSSPTAEAVLCTQCAFTMLRTLIL